ncbi:UNVERIFIED_CONTAM: hypothetical protein Sradi_2992300, partial [Sesamum radiatum]
VMQSGITIFDSLENFTTLKDIGSRLKMCLASAERDYALINAYDTVYASLFTYDHDSDIIKVFYEAWCPLINTLLTSVGELSISLWDLHDLARLPVTGCLFDEVVPSALELTGTDEKGAIKYHLPSPRKEKKMLQPKSTHNPLGDIATHRWSTAEEALFEKLCIEGNLKGEVYLAAYLACWLCTFVLPDKLHGPKMTRFFSEGGAKYYDPQKARKRIHKAEFVSWACNMIVKNRFFKFIDSGDAEELDHDYFIAIRLSYLTLCKGDKFIIEPYSPHRFRRQFGKKSPKITLNRKTYEDMQVDGDGDNPSPVLVPSLEDEIQSIDASEELETSHSWTMTPPLGMGLKRKQLPRLPAVSVFEG